MIALRDTVLLPSKPSQFFSFQTFTMAHDMPFSRRPCIVLATGYPGPRWKVGCFLILLLLLTETSTRTFAEDPMPISIAELDRTEPVDFEKEILPILRKSCLACHNATGAENELILETPQTIQQGGSGGPAVVPTKSLESLLLLVAAHLEEPVMPPVDNDQGAKPLTPDELGLIKKWIDEGAEGTVTGGKKPLTWQPVSHESQPILATAISQDGQYVACGRGNQLFVYHVPTFRLVAQLVDANLSNSSDQNPLQVAHLDTVQSLAFSPKADLLASGGYRTVKLWRRSPNARLSEADIGVTPGVLAMTANSRWVASGESSGVIRLLDLTGEYDVRRLEGHNEPVTALVFSDDGMWLVSAAPDKTIRIWNVSEGHQVAGFTVPAAVHAMTVINQGSQIITGEGDNVIRVWATPELATKTATDEQGVPGDDDLGGDLEAKPATPVRELSGHEGEITALASLPGASHQFVSGSLDGTFRIWDADQGSQLQKFDAGSAITALAVRPDGKRLVGVTKDRVAKLWNLTDGQLVAEFKGDQRIRARIPELDRVVQLAETEVAHHKSMKEAAEKQLQESEKALAQSNKAQAAAEIKLAQAIERAKKAEQKKTAAEQAVAAANVILQQVNRSQSLAAESVKQSAQALQRLAQLLQTTRQDALEYPDDQSFNDALAAVEQALQESVSKQNEIDEALLAQLAVANEAAESAVESNKKQVEILARKFAQVVAEVQVAEKKKESLIAAGKIASQNLEQAKQKTSQATEELAAAEQVQKDHEQRRNETAKAAEASRTQITAVAFAHDNTYLALGDVEHRIQLLDASTGDLFLTLNDQPGPIHTVRFAQDTSLVAFAVDGKMVVWQVQPKWVLERTIGHVDEPAQLVDRVLALDFSPDGKLLATGSGEPSRSGELKIWQVADGQLVYVIDDAHSDTVFAVEFSPDGKTIASSAADQLVKTFQVDDGQLVYNFLGHTHHALDVAWQANGRRLASAGADHVIKVWDPSTGEQKRTIEGYLKEVTSVSFVSVGSEVLATSGDSTIRLHNTDNGSVIRKLEGAKDFVHTAVATPGGELVVAGSRDSVLRAWNLKDGKLRGSFAPHEPPKEDSAGQDN